MNYIQTLRITRIVLVEFRKNINDPKVYDAYTTFINKLSDTINEAKNNINI